MSKNFFLFKIMKLTCMNLGYFKSLRVYDGNDGGKVVYGWSDSHERVKF